MSALKIKVDDDYEKEYSLMGISCHLKDYRLVYLINNCLSLDLKKQDDLIIYPTKGKQKLQFSFYHYQQDHFEYNLIANRNPLGTLIQEHKHFDYILLIKGRISKKLKQNLLQKLLKISNVLAAIEIKPNTVKLLAHIISDLELHLMEITKSARKLESQ